MKFQKCPKKFLRVSKHVLRWFHWNFFVHCTLEGREVEKFQKNGMTSDISNWPKTFSNVSILVLRGFFSNFYLPVHPGDQKFEQKLKKIEFLKVSKNVLKSFQTSSELVLRYFSGKNFCPVHAGGSKLGKISKKWKNFHFSSKSPNKFPKRFKRVLNMLRGSFLVKKLTSAPWRVETWKNSKKKSTKIWNFKSVQKRS